MDSLADQAQLRKKKLNLQVNKWKLSKQKPKDKKKKKEWEKITQKRAPRSFCIYISNGLTYMKFESRGKNERE